MATLTSNNPTLMDLAKRLDPEGNIAAVVEILNQTLEILQDVTFQEGNLLTGHRSTIRTGLPTPTWRKFYGGVQPTKSTTSQVTDPVGMLEAYAEVDKALADLNGNTAAFRLSEDKPHIEGMNQELADRLFYADSSTVPEQFNGLAPRYDDLSAPSGDNIVDGGGTGADNRSIWLIVWSPETVFGIVPKGSATGLQVEDKGQVTIEDVDGSGGRMEAYRTHYRWDAGLVVKDWRFAVRIANIDRSDLTADASAGADLPDLMFTAMELVPNLAAGRAAFYMARDVRTFLRKQTAAAVSSSTLTTENVGGVPVTFFNGIPLRRVDALATNEAQVT